MNIFQKIKSGMLISGAVLIVAGLVLLFFPVTTTKMIAYIAAAMLLFMGIVEDTAADWCLESF